MACMEVCGPAGGDYRRIKVMSDRFLMVFDRGAGLLCVESAAQLGMVDGV